jgi:DNA-directed RNA polymerase subunit beta
MPERIIDRRSYAKLPPVLDLPNLLEVQMKSFEDFLQAGVSADKREDTGLHGVFESIFPIADIHNLYSLEFVDYSLGRPKYSVRECIERGATYCAPLRAPLKRVIPRRRPRRRKSAM